MNKLSKIDKNYLGHELEPLYKNQTNHILYTCSRCNITVWTNGLKYLHLNGGFGNRKLLTCDELIIKSIIE